MAVQEEILITNTQTNTNTQFSSGGLAVKKENPLGHSRIGSKYNNKNLPSRKDLCRISLALLLQDFLQHTDAEVLLIVWLVALCDIATGDVSSTHFSVFKSHVILFLISI